LNVVHSAADTFYNACILNPPHFKAKSSCLCCCSFPCLTAVCFKVRELWLTKFNVP